MRDTRDRDLVDGEERPPDHYGFYPQRPRCVTCRRPLMPPLVIKRLYDSYECAGMVPPSRDRTLWPREHRRGNGDAKITYLYPEQVNSRPGNTIWLYPCDYCGMYHLGHKSRKSRR